MAGLSGAALGEGITYPDGTVSPFKAGFDNWKLRGDGTSQEAEIQATTIPPSDDRESALAVTLAPGNYTAIVRGKGNTTGVGLVEVYHLQ